MPPRIGVNHVLLLFLDGIGLGVDDPTINPFAAAHLPTLHALSSGQRWLASTGIQHSDRAVFIPTNPRLGIPGRPQSGSNQAVIFTGRNIPRLIGRHYGPKPNLPIRTLLDADNLFLRLSAAHKSAALLEAYPPPWHKGINSGKSLPSSYQYAARTAGLRFRTVDDLRQGDALSGDWTGAGWHTQLGFEDTPIYKPQAAGRKLAELARRDDFALFPHWLTDVVGHRGPLTRGVELLQTFDGVMAGLLDAWGDDDGLIIVTSDHGNLEDISDRKHTTNDVPTLVIGPKPARMAFAEGAHGRLHDLTHIAPRIAHALGVDYPLTDLPDED